VHRDIKPENIRVRRDLAGLHVKVLDFGIARLVDGVGTRLTMEGGVAGTPRYMAPEQIAAGTIDARTDIYALGLVLFEAMTGREAFTRETTSQLMWAQLNDPVPAVVEVQPLRDYPALDAVIAQACAKEPAERFASAQALVEALKDLQTPQWWACRCRWTSWRSNSWSGNWAQIEPQYPTGSSTWATMRAEALKPPCPS